MQNYFSNVTYKKRLSETRITKVRGIKQTDNKKVLKNYSYHKPPSTVWSLCST